MREIWTLQAAKQRCSAVEAASDDERLKQLETLHQPSRTELLLAIPHDDASFETPELEARAYKLRKGQRDPVVVVWLEQHAKH
ncbi:hypothetical protein [Synechococcus sp. HK05]|uniref:hypothetical protein n=1 Tax=Synechococcus sp. HK05 TaxID=2725975 RepID=UPI0020CB304A|nr:hypothetical protein [Synechococcus sp. HK05]